MKHLTTKGKKRIDFALLALTIVMIVASTFFYGTIFRKTASKDFENSKNYYSINKITELANRCASLLSVKRLDLYICEYDKCENYIVFDEEKNISDISLVLGYKQDKYYYYKLILEDGVFKLEFLSSQDSHGDILKYQFIDLVNNIQIFPKKEIFYGNRVNISTEIVNDISPYSNDYLLKTPEYKQISLYDEEKLRGYFSYLSISDYKVYYEVNQF